MVCLHVQYLGVQQAQGHIEAVTGQVIHVHAAGLGVQQAGVGTEHRVLEVICGVLRAAALVL